MHIIISTYLILALATICDDYFVPVLEMLCDSLHLSNDVAGATFMAAGGTIFHRYRRFHLESASQLHDTKMTWHGYYIKV